MKYMHFPENINALVASDFDETYYAHAMDNIDDVKALTDYLSSSSDVLFGIVSASTIDMIHDCLAAEHFTHYPHFISSNSGTELRFYKEGKEIYDIDYEKTLLKQGFTKQTILNVVAELQNEGIELMIQQPFIHAPFSRNYYYRETGHDEEAFQHIRNKALENNLIVNISKCNPLIGDPADCYDVDFFPKTAGKDAVVRYLIERFHVPFEQTFAFGDSGNDIKMLQSVRHGYLVNNATAEAKLLHSTVAEHPYNKGILTTLQHLRGEMNG